MSFKSTIIKTNQSAKYYNKGIGLWFIVRTLYAQTDSRNDGSTSVFKWNLDLYKYEEGKHSVISLYVAYVSDIVLGFKVKMVTLTFVMNVSLDNGGW